MKALMDWNGNEYMAVLSKAKRVRNLKSFELLIQ